MELQLTVHGKPARVKLMDRRLEGSQHVIRDNWSRALSQDPVLEQPCSAEVACVEVYARGNDYAAPVTLVNFFVCYQSRSIFLS